MYPFLGFYFSSLCLPINLCFCCSYLVGQFWFCRRHFRQASTSSGENLLVGVWTSSGENLLVGVWRWRVGVSNFKRGEEMRHKESGLQKLFFI